MHAQVLDARVRDRAAGGTWSNVFGTRGRRSRHRRSRRDRSHAPPVEGVVPARSAGRARWRSSRRCSRPRAGREVDRRVDLDFVAGRAGNGFHAKSGRRPRRSGSRSVNGGTVDEGQTQLKVWTGVATPRSPSASTAPRPSSIYRAPARRDRRRGGGDVRRAVRVVLVEVVEDDRAERGSLATGTRYARLRGPRPARTTGRREGEGRRAGRLDRGFSVQSLGNERVAVDPGSSRRADGPDAPEQVPFGTLRARVARVSRVGKSSLPRRGRASSSRGWR